MTHTINAQSIINEVMAAHAVAPGQHEETATGGRLVFQTSEKGFHKIINCKTNLQKFADLVRKNAAAFGGGLIREAKPRPAVSWPSKLINLFKTSVQDKDWQAVFDLGEKLGAMYYPGSDGRVYMQVAPVPCEFDSRLVSAMNENGKWSVTEPVSMRGVSGYSAINKSSRNAQIEAVLAKYSKATDEVKNAMFAKAYETPEDQDLARAKWMLEHGLDDDRAIAARIAEQARIDAENQAAYDARQAEKAKSLQQLAADEMERIKSETAKYMPEVESLASDDFAQVVASAIAAEAIDAASEYKSPYIQYLEDIGFLKSDTVENCSAAAISKAMEHYADSEDLVTCEADSSEASEVTTGAAFSAGFEPVSSSNYGGYDFPPTAPVAVSGAVSDTPAAESADQSWPDEYSIKVARYSKNKVSVTTPSKDGYKTRAARLAGTFGRWSNRDNGYIMSRGQASTFARLYADGWDASIMGSGAASREAPTPAPAVSTVEPTPPVAASKPKTIEEANAAINAHAMASEFRDYFAAEKSAHDRHEIVGQWRSQFIGSCAELIASNDIACTDYGKLCQLVDNGKLTFERACEMIDSAVSAGIFDGKTGEYIKKNIAPIPAPAVSSAEATSPAAVSTEAQAVSVPAVQPDSTPTIRAKSGAYCAWFFMLTSGAFGLRFAVPGQPDITAEFATWHDRMVAVQSMGRAIDYPPTDSPAAGQDGPTVADSDPVATTAPAVSAEEPTPAVAVSTEETEAAEDAATLAIIKARESSAKMQAAIAYTQALTELPGQYPDLKLAKDNPSQGGKLAASNLRIMLKKAFGGAKFKVVSNYDRVSVKWTDGPSFDAVTAITRLFKTGKSDTNSNYFYTEDSAFTATFGGAQYVFNERETSDSLIQMAIDSRFSGSQKPSLEDFKAGKNDCGFWGFKGRWIRETLNTISA